MNGSLTDCLTSNTVQANCFPPGRESLRPLVLMPILILLPSAITTITSATAEKAAANRLSLSPSHSKIPSHLTSPAPGHPPAPSPTRATAAEKRSEHHPAPLPPLPLPFLPPVPCGADSAWKKSRPRARRRAAAASGSGFPCARLDDRPTEPAHFGNILAAGTGGAPIRVGDLCAVPIEKDWGGIAGIGQ